MESLVLAFAIAMAIVALVLYFELKNTQERVERIRSDIERRVNSTIENVIHTAADKIPELEKRIEEMAQRLAEKEAQEEEEKSGAKDKD